MALDQSLHQSLTPGPNEAIVMRPLEKNAA
jgi:hypothetical protein